MARKIIIDTDPGQDDAVAILLALASPELDILALPPLQEMARWRAQKSMPARSAKWRKSRTQKYLQAPSAHWCARLSPLKTFMARPARWL